MGIDWLYKYNPHINWRRNRCISYNTSTRGRCIIEATDFTSKRPDYLVSAKQIARVAEKKLPASIHTTYAWNGRCVTIRLWLLSQQQTSNRSFRRWKDHTPRYNEKASPRIQGHFPENPRADQLNSKLTLYQAANVSKDQPTSYPSSDWPTKRNKSTTRWWSASFDPAQAHGAALHKASIKKNCPFPRIEEVWDQLGGSKYFSDRLAIWTQPYTNRRSVRL
jgi:hypothetical protein